MLVHAASEADVEAYTARQSHVSLLFIAKYAVAFFGILIALLPPVIATLAIRVAAIDPAAKSANLSIVLFLGAIMAMIGNPLFGQLSDRTRTGIGRRRPWIIGGAIVGCLSLGVIAVAGSIWLICVAWCFAQLAMNAALAALVAVVPDQVPIDQRAKVSAVVGVAFHLAILAGIGLISLVGTVGIGLFAVPTVLGFACVMWFALTVHDKQPTTVPPPWQLRDLLNVFWINPFKYADFGWAWLSRFLVTIAFAFLSTYQVYYLMDVLSTPAAEIPHQLFLIHVISTCFGSVSALALGALSDRIGRRKIFVLVSAIVYSIGIALIVTNPTYIGFLIGYAIGQIGAGAYLSVDQAVVVDVLPNSKTEAAKNMGIINIANVLPQSLAPALAPLILAIGATGGSKNYMLLYTVAAAVAFLGALAIVPIRGVR